MNNDNYNGKNVPRDNRAAREKVSGTQKQPTIVYRNVRNDAAALTYIKDGKSMFFSSLVFGLIVLAINIIVLIWFDGSLWSLYWTNMGFVVVRPILGFFNNQVFQVINLETGETWEDSHWLLGIVIGLAVLGIATLVLFSIADAIFPPYTFMKDFILIAVAAFVSGRFVLQQFRMAFLGLRMWRSGKKTLKDPNPPFVSDVIEPLFDKFAVNTVIITVCAVIVCILAVVVQYVQMWILTPKIRSSLDTLKVYQSSEDALPFPTEVIENAVGEFSDFSTEYETEYEADLEYNGVKGHYEQNVVYEYNFEEKKWTSFVGGYSISLTDANVSGVWSGNDCVDNVDGTENMTFVLDIKSLTPQSANGTFTVSNATGQTYSSKWSGTVTFENGCLYVTGTLSNPRNMFFGIGRDSFNFTYYIMDGTVTVTDDYFGTLERQ